MPELQLDYSVQYLLPPCLEDWLPEDHPARFIRDLVDQLNLDQLGFHTDVSPDGRSRYPTHMLLKLWLFAYYHQIRSSRKLEAACREMIGAVWLAARHEPDHNTLWRFWSANRQAIRSLFKHSVRVAGRCGLTSLALHALDGTTIAAAASRRSAWHKQDLEKDLERLDERLVQMEEQIRQAGPGGEAAYRLEKKLQGTAERKKAVREALEELAREQVEALHPHERDAQMMNCEGRRQWAWNAQAVVEEKSGIVVAADVTSSASDAHQLRPMLRQVKENLGADQRVERVVADTGYAKSDEEVSAAEQEGHSFVTGRPREEDEAYHRSRFTFSRERMELVCPRGERLRHTGSSKWRYGEGRVERFRCTGWRECPVAALCCGRSRNGRRVEISPAHEDIERQRAQVTAEQRRALMKRRLGLVEPLFAQTKSNEGFRRFSVRGEEKVRCQWLMLCLTRNLKVLKKAWEKGQVALREVAGAGRNDRQRLGGAFLRFEGA